ncbi:phosphoribosyltransferase family protein [Kitasatospora sp. NBC_01287]|uniref:phosphoribosyltransferase family protein n=1 Tax=Kitasatospora sp. NBC_01287 TaxID=2903573 RepID=UPI0022534885|nr:phosphoribosyltransferase family protein [Kitasatospora sp. NBC_01287]MCX4746209.1 phosphoribosyltransferase family protein [Kitasatospora sp. NBC_01287]
MPSRARDLLLEHFRWIDGHADVWSVFRDPVALAAVVAGIVDPFRDAQVTAVCGIESRGFLLGAAAAVELGVGFVPVRKPDGLFPGDKLSARTDPDYRQRRHTLRLQRSSLGPGDRVLLVDDWIETGSQAITVRRMVEECGSRWVGCGVMVDQLRDERRALLGRVVGVVRAGELPASVGSTVPPPTTR